MIALPHQDGTYPADSWWLGERPLYSATLKPENRRKDAQLARLSGIFSRLSYSG
jgi:hypothetical protein